MILKKRYFKKLDLPTSGEVYSITLPKNITDITIQCRSANEVKYSDSASNIASGDYWTIKANSIDFDVDVPSTGILYFSGTADSLVIEIRGFKQINDFGKE